MPSSLFNALGGSVPSQNAVGIPQNMMASLTQFRNMFAPILQAQNPAQAVQNILAQRGVSPAQFQQIINQYSAQATAIQNQLLGR